MVGLLAGLMIVRMVGLAVGLMTGLVLGLVVGLADLKGPRFLAGALRAGHKKDRQLSLGKHCRSPSLITRS